MRIKFALIAMLLSVSVIGAQGQSVGGGAALPGTCSLADIFARTNTPAAAALCGSVDTWVYFLLVAPRVVTATDATSITPNTHEATITYQLNTQSAGTLTINADASSPAPNNGQYWLLKIKSTNAQTLSWNGVYVAGTTRALPTATTGSSKIDYIGFLYDGVTAKWHMIAFAMGF